MRVPAKNLSENPRGAAPPTTSAAEPQESDEMLRALSSIDALAKETGPIEPLFRAATTSLRKTRGLIVVVARDFEKKIGRAQKTLDPASSAARNVIASAMRSVDTMEAGHRAVTSVGSAMEASAANAIRGQLFEKVREKSDQLASEVVEAIRATKLEIEKQEADAFGPSSMQTRGMPDLRDVLLDSQRAQEAKAMGMRAALATLRGYVDRKEGEKEAIWTRVLVPVATEIVNASAAEIRKSRPAERSGEIDAERNAAIELLAYVRRLRVERAPAWIPIARKTYAELLDAFGLLVGQHARWMTANEFKSFMYAGSTPNALKGDELAIDPTWCVRYLPPYGAGVRLPAWDPRKVER